MNKEEIREYVWHLRHTPKAMKMYLEKIGITSDNPKDHTALFLCINNLQLSLDTLYNKLDSDEE